MSCFRICRNNKSFFILITEFIINIIRYLITFIN